MSTTASDKQIAFITRLFTQARDLTEKTGLTSDAETAIAPVQQIIVNATANPELVTKRDASKAIDALMSFTKLAGNVAAKAEFPALNRAERVIPNRFAKDCKVCGSTVEAETGHAALIFGSWATYCTPCAKGEVPAAPAAPAAPTYTPERGEVHVIDGTFYRVSISQRGRAYLNEWTGTGYGYAPNVSVRKLSEATLATAEQAAEFGKAFSCCCFCARDLDTPESISVGYGPTCAARRGLPWGVKADA